MGVSIDPSTGLIGSSTGGSTSGGSTSGGSTSGGSTSGGSPPPPSEVIKEGMLFVQ